MAVKKPVKLSAKAKRLLERVAKHVEQDYRRLDMSQWGYRASEAGYEPEETPSCNTVGCIGGWTVILGAADGGKRLLKSDWALGKAMGRAELTASKMLGLSRSPVYTEDDYFPSEHERLFMVDDWPERYRRDYDNLSDRNKARRTAARIRHFIKHGR